MAVRQTTAEAFQQDVLSKASTVVVDFYADWCGPCKKIAPIMEELALEYEGKVLFYKVNVDAERKLATVFQIRNIPTVFFLPKEGQPMSQVGGLTKEDYVKIINEHLIN